jgi:hypothetical protein
MRVGEDVLLGLLSLMEEQCAELCAVKIVLRRESAPGSDWELQVDAVKELISENVHEAFGQLRVVAAAYSLGNHSPNDLYRNVRQVLDTVDTPDDLQ